MRMFFFLSALSLSLASCTVQIEDVLRDRKVDAEKKFKQFYACYSIAKSTPAIAENKIDWEANDAKVGYKESNVYQISLQNFKDLSKPLDIAYDGTRRREHADMARLFAIDLSAYRENHQLEEDKDYRYHSAESGEFSLPAIHHFLDSKYLLINRTTRIVEPKYIGDDQFESGFVSGDVLVFNVEQGKLLGGFMFEAKNSENIKLHYQSSDVDDNLQADLSNQVVVKIKEKFTGLTPSLADSNFNF